MTLLVITLICFIILGMPIGYALGLSGTCYFMFCNPSLISLLPERVFSGMDSFLLLSLPLFILMGLIMNAGNLTARMVNLMMVLVGRVRGGLAVVNVMVSMVFGGISGSSVSDTASVGAILIPEMEKNGYSKEFASGVTVASSTMGMIIPPSIPMLIYASISMESVGKLFVGTMIPGILIGLFMIVITIFLAKKRNVPKTNIRINSKETRKLFKEGILALLMPLLIIGAIVFGITTTTEAAALGALYAFIIGFFVTKTLKKESFIPILKQTIKMSASCMIVIAFSKMFIWILAVEHVPENMLLFIESLNLSKWVILLFVDLIILFIGMFLDVSPALMLITPVFLPAMTSIGVDPIQFGAILITGLAIGLVTPPVGMCLNVASSITNLSIIKIFKAATPFVLANIFTLILVTYVPQISLALPNLIK